MGWEFTCVRFFVYFRGCFSGIPNEICVDPRPVGVDLNGHDYFLSADYRQSTPIPIQSLLEGLRLYNLKFTSEAFTYHRRLSNVIQNLFKPRSLTQLFFPGISRIWTLSMKPFLFDTPLVFQPNDYTMFDELFLGIVMRITINLSCFLASGFRCCVLRLFSSFVAKGRCSTIVFTQHPLRITPTCKDSPRQRWSKKSPRKVEDQLPSNFPTTNNVRE